MKFGSVLPRILSQSRELARFVGAHIVRPYIKSANRTHPPKGANLQKNFSGLFRKPRENFLVLTLFKHVRCTVPQRGTPYKSPVPPAGGSDLLHCKENSFTCLNSS